MPCKDYKMRKKVLQNEGTRRMERSEKSERVKSNDEGVCGGFLLPWDAWRG